MHGVGAICAQTSEIAGAFFFCKKTGCLAGIFCSVWDFGTINLRSSSFTTAAVRETNHFKTKFQVAAYQP